jgi:arylsulfatase A-like enzyme
MAKHLINGHIYWQQNKYMRAPKIRFDEYDMRKWDADALDGRVHVAEYSFEVEVPDDFDPRPQMVATLEAEKRQLRAEFAAKVTEIDAQIQKLLAIENTVDAA